MRDGTLCFLVRGDPPDLVLLGLKKRGFGAGKWGGFGGKIDPGETPVSCAVRELEEESGVIADERDLCHVAELYFDFPSCQEWSQLVHVYVCARWIGEPAESSEMVPGWFSCQDLPLRQMWDDCSYWLPRILAGERFSAHFTYGSDNEGVVRVKEDSLRERACDRVAEAASDRSLRAEDV